MYRFSPGDKVVSVGNTVNCATAGRSITIRRPYHEGRYGDDIARYIVVFDDGLDNYRICGSLGYIMRDLEMEFADEPLYETDE